MKRLIVFIIMIGGEAYAECALFRLELLAFDGQKREIWMSSLMPRSEAEYKLKYSNDDIPREILCTGTPEWDARVNPDIPPDLTLQPFHN